MGTYKIFAVEDDPVMRESLLLTLQEEFAVETFVSAEECRARLADERPDLFLLDICLPGVDGYVFCRELKDAPETSGIPAIFVSSQDSIEDRLAGYDAGGVDFVVKPVDITELQRKIAVVQQSSVEKKNLVEQVQTAEQLTSMVLASMDEFGVVLQFLGKVIACGDGREVCEAMQHLMKSFRLEGAVQTRVGGRELTMNQEGEASALEISIVDHVRTLGRQFEFRNKSVLNFDRVTVMITNMPLADADLCGRIRDNLSMACQGADSRLQGIETELANAEKRQGIFEMLDNVRATISQLSQSQQAERALATGITQELQEDLMNSFVHLGLTDNQEHYLDDLVRKHTKRLIDLLDRGEQTQAVLEGIVQDLERLGA